MARCFARPVAIAALLAAANLATANVLDIATAPGLFAPSFRGDADSSYVGWDLFDDGGTLTDVINDTTPDVGTHTGSFVTTNNEDHLSGSGNYYSGFGTVAEEVTFEAGGVSGTGYTTVIVQAKTLPGFGWNDAITLDFGPIDGVAPTQVLLADNAAAAGQLFVKYEVPGTISTPTFSIASSFFQSHTSIDVFTVDAVWSPNGYAADYAIATPEPAAAATALIGIAGLMLRRRS